MPISDFDTSAIIVVSSVAAIAWAFIQFQVIAKTPVKSLDIFNDSSIELIKKDKLKDPEDVDHEKLFIER